MSTPEVRNNTVWDIFFGDSDSDSDFEGFTAEEISEQQLRVEIARETYRQENGSASDIDPAELAQRLIEDLHADDVTVADLEWSETSSDEITLFPFNGDESGPFHNLGCTGDQLDFFQLFMTDDFLDHLVRETNKYAQFRQDLSQKVDTEWSPVDRNEMKAYIGVLILMGIHSLPEIRDYWSTDDRLHVPGIAKVMSRNRFLKLNQYFHVNDPYGEPDRQDPGRDRMYKVRPMIDQLRSKFPTKFIPFREISIDEAMCKFAGRSPMIQYMPAKPVKWGFKIWSAACPRTGYTFDMIPYAGKGEHTQHGLGYSVVVDLTSRYCGLGHHIYYDNFFSSLRLAVDLLNRQTYVCSTVRKNSKGLPAAVSKPATKLKPGDYVYRASGEITATLWHDKRDVTLLSSNCNPGGLEVQRKGKEIFVPTVVREYNKYMGGVDLSDQMASYYPINNKYMKFWKYLFCFFVDRMIINAFILYGIAHSPNPRRRYRQKDYRLDLASQLIGGFTSRRKRGPQSQVTEVENSINADNIANHICEVLSPNAKRKKKCCRQCSKTGKKTSKGYPVETTWGCKQCNVHLCKNECFLEYHASILRH